MDTQAPPYKCNVPEQLEHSLEHHMAVNPVSHSSQLCDMQG